MQTNAAVIKSDGTWSTVLDTSECDTQLNYTLVVRTLSLSGMETVTISDIRLGEVWVCSGQSNMQFTVSQVRNEDQRFDQRVELDQRSPLVELSQQTFL